MLEGCGRKGKKEECCVGKLKGWALGCGIG